MHITYFFLCYFELFIMFHFQYTKIVSAATASSSYSFFLSLFFLNIIHIYVYIPQCTEYVFTSLVFTYHKSIEARKNWTEEIVFMYMNKKSSVNFVFPLFTLHRFVFNRIGWHNCVPSWFNFHKFITKPNKRNGKLKMSFSFLQLYCSVDDSKVHESCLFWKWTLSADVCCTSTMAAILKLEIY